MREDSRFSITMTWRGFVLAAFAKRYEDKINNAGLLFIEKPNPEDIRKSIWDDTVVWEWNYPIQDVSRGTINGI